MAVLLEVIKVNHTRKYLFLFRCKKYAHSKMLSIAECAESRDFCRYSTAVSQYSSKALNIDLAQSSLIKSQTLI